MIDPDELEADILLKMVYDQYEPFSSYQVNFDNKSYYVVFNSISVTNPKSTRIFKLNKVSFNKYEVIIDQAVKSSEEYKYLSIFKLNEVERLFVTSCMIGNNKSIQYLPDYIRDKVKVKGVIYESKISMH